VDNKKDPFDKDFILTGGYCTEECDHFHCCILSIAMVQYSIKNISFDQGDKDWGCAHIQELRWMRKREEEDNNEKGGGLNGGNSQTKGRG